MHPVTTTRAPVFRASVRARTVSIDSWRAASTKAQVLTTTSSASSARAAGSRPSARRLATTLSESTAFFGHPRVSTQKDGSLTAGQGTWGCPGHPRWWNVRSGVGHLGPAEGALHQEHQRLL